MDLRNYQKHSKQLILEHFRKGIKRVVLCLPTGAGKTIVFSSICHDSITKARRPLITTHRKELAKQASKYTTAQVIMVETLYNLIKAGFNLNVYDLIIIDEAHIGNFTKILHYYKGYVIGATATPNNAMRALYDEIVCPISISELIKQQYLAKPITYLKTGADITSLVKRSGEYTPESLNNVYNKPNVYNDMVNDYVNNFTNTKAIVFNCSIAHSKSVHTEFLARGVNSYHIDSKMPTTKRDEIVLQFENSTNGVLNNCGIATTGFDVPDIAVVIVNRATDSLALWLQMCGRGSRVCAGKTSFKILDYGQNITRFGHWEAGRNWSEIFHKKARDKKEQPHPIKECKQCEAVNYASTKVCFNCGYQFKAHEIEYSSGELKIIEYNIIINDFTGVKVSMLSADNLLRVASVKGWKQTYVEAILYSFNIVGLYQFWDNKGYKSMYKNRRLDTFIGRNKINDFIIKF